MEYSGWRFAFEHPYLSAFVVIAVAYFVCQGAVYVAAALKGGK
jgi:hypothetical protein